MDPVLRTALRKHNELRQQLDNVLLGDNGDIWEKEFKNFLAQRPCWISNLSILEPVSTVLVLEKRTKFIAKERFVINPWDDAPVKITYLGLEFKQWFLDGEGKIENPVGDQTLHYHKLRQSSTDGLIFRELGGKAKAETTLSEIFSLMEKQRKGESGPLLNINGGNIFYVKDQDDVLRSVLVIWRGNGWGVRARVINTPNWRDTYRVFSRNSTVPLFPFTMKGTE